MMPASRAAVVLLVLATSGCTSGASPAPSMQHGPEPAPIATTLTSTTSGVGARSPLHDLPLPEPVEYRDDPRTAAVADPSFVALPGATAHFGRLGSAVYQIEIPDRWNGRLVMWAHGCEEFAPQASVAGPDLRPYLISHGYAWAASSFSSTSMIPGLAGDETAALWDYFSRTFGRADWTYVGGQSMGGWTAQLAAERYPDRFDGALAFCGASGVEDGFAISAEFFVAAAYVAGVTQAEFDATDVDTLIDTKILPALQDRSAHSRFEDLLIDLTGGPRAGARAGIDLEETTNWQRARLVIRLGLVPSDTGPYTLAGSSGIDAAAFNAGAIRLRRDAGAADSVVARDRLTGDIRMPLLTLHTTGDGQVPINEAQKTRAAVAAAGRGALLVQRVIQDQNHCGFTTPEKEAAFEALTDWVERHITPAGTDLTNHDLAHLDHTFEQSPHAFDASVPSGRQVSIAGVATLDGLPFDARWIGAVVRGDGLVNPCQATLPPIDHGAFDIALLPASEVAGCGAPGSEIAFWTYVDDRRLFSTAWIPWPSSPRSTTEIAFDTTNPSGAVPMLSAYYGEAYQANGDHVAAGRPVEAYVGGTLCGRTSIRDDRTFLIGVVGPDTNPACSIGAEVSFRVDGTSVPETVTNGTPRPEVLYLTVAEPPSPPK